MTICRIVVSVGLVMVLAASVPVLACVPSQGQIYVPTGTSNPPPGAPSLYHGIATYLIPPGDTFSVVALAPVTTVSSSPCVKLPDLNVAWYKVSVPFDTLVDHADSCGNEGGTMAGNPDYGVVYLKYGPEPSASDDSVGTKFSWTVCA